MYLSEIYDWAGPPRGQPVVDLTDALKALGVEVEFWQHHTPRPLDVDAVRTHFEESAETSLRDHDTLLRKFAEGDPEIAELVVRSMAESLFGATSHEKFTLLSKGHDGCLELLRGLNSASYIWWLVSMADRLAEEGKLDSAIEVYREAIEECPRPNLHSELGRILADRAGVSSHLVGAPESAILSELDISLPLTFTWDSGGNETSTRPQQPELLEDSLLDHPLGSQSKKLLRLALESYGRAYVGHLAEVMAGEMTSMEAECLFFRHCLVLDGLRVLFLEMTMLEEAEIVCHVFEIWNGVIAEEGGEAARADFQRRFAQTLGRLYADQSIGSPLEREVVRDKLGREMNGFALLPAMVQEYLTSARIYLDRSDKKADAAHVVTELYKALEATLQATLGRAAIEGDLVFLQHVYRQVRPSAKRPLEAANLPAFKDVLRNVADSPFSRKLVASWLAAAVNGEPELWLNNLVRTVESLVERDRARHANASWKVVRQTASDLYDSCLGDDNSTGFIVGLLRAAWKTRGGSR